VGTDDGRSWPPNIANRWGIMTLDWQGVLIAMAAVSLRIIVEPREYRPEVLRINKPSETQKKCRIV
jgi:hypothetical protein